MRREGIIQSYQGNNKDKNIYIITRDPYKRIESFYKEKLLKNMIAGFTQHCQQKLLQYFPLDRLLEKQVSFQEFIGAIEQGYSDAHIGLQSNILKKYTPTVKIKLEGGLDQLTTLLGVNPNTYIRNTTDEVNVWMQWTPEMRHVINTIYATDFVNMGYSMI